MHVKAEARRRERRGIQVANVALYTAALLLVTAAGLFVTTAAGTGVRLGGIVAAAVAFYTGGLVLHASVPRLRPAAVAFAGTGLALVPLAGVAFDALWVHSASATWAVTSLVGVAAYGYAALRLESRVLVFASLGFVLATAWSGASALGGPLALGFAAIIGAAAVIGWLGLARPSWAPPLVVRSAAQLHPFVVPAVLAGSTIAAGALERWQYPVLVAIMGAYLTCEAFLPATIAVRRWAWWGARWCAMVAAGAFVAHAVDGGLLGTNRELDASLVAAVVALGLQAGVVEAISPRLASRLRYAKRGLALEQSVGVWVQLVAVAFLAVSGLISRADGSWLFSALAVTEASAMLVAWKHGRATEGLVLLVFVEAILARGAMVPWQAATLAAAVVLYWHGRARGASAGLWQPGHHLVAARLGSLVAVPLAADAVLGALPSASPADRSAAVALSVVVAAAAQLAVTGVLAWRGRPELRRGVMAAVLAGIAAIASALVLTAARPGEETLYAAAAGAVAAGAVVLMVGLTRPAGSAGESVAGPAREGRVGRWVPPAMLGLSAATSFAGGRWDLGNATLIILCAVFAFTAWRAAEPAQRWRSLWLARGSATLLAGTVVLGLEEQEHLLLWIGDQQVVPWHAVAAAALAQLGVPLAAHRRSLPAGAFRWALPDAAAVLATAAVALCALPLAGGYGAPLAAGPGLLTVTLLMTFAMAAAVAGAVFASIPVSVAFPSAGLAVSAVLSGGNLRLLEVVVGLYAVDAAVMVYLAPHRRSKGAFLVAVRALPLALTALVAHDVAGSATVLSMALALGLAAQHAVRLLLPRAAAGLPFGSAVYWTGLAGQLALPWAYLPVAGREPGGGRWVVLIELALVLVSVAATMRRRPRAGFVGLAAAVGLTVAAGPYLRFGAHQVLADPLFDAASVVLLAAAFAAGHIVGMLRWTPVVTVEAPAAAPWPWTATWPWTTGASSFAVLSLVAAVCQTAAVPTRLSWLLMAAGLGSVAAVLIAASHVWRRVPGVVPLAFPAAALITMGVGWCLANGFFPAGNGPWAQVPRILVGSLLPGALWLALRWAPPVRRGMHPADAAASAPGSDPIRRWSAVGTALGGLVAAAVLLHEPPTAGIMPFLAAPFVAVTVSELPRPWRRTGVELGLLPLVAATEWAVFAGAGEASAFWLAQWYAVVTAVVALLRYIAAQRTVGKLWLMAASAVVTLSGASAVFTGDAASQVCLLVGFAALTAAGVAFGERLVTIWGAAGVLACVLWAVRSYAYAFLGILGLALIAAVVWRLVRPRGV